jgi:DNA-binding XRE family transcriptional regulator
MIEHPDTERRTSVARGRDEARVGPRAGTPAPHEQESLRRGFGARLRELGKAAGLTQAQLAERAGLDRGACVRLELGRRPEGRTVRRLWRNWCHRLSGRGNGGT